MIVGPETPPTTAFNIDVTNTQTSSSSACSLVTPSYSVLYHNGLLAYPVIRDVIFRDELATILFNGNGLWYSTTLGIAVKIDVDGTVLDTFQCGVGSLTPTNPTWISMGALSRSSESALAACGAAPTGAFWRTGTFGANPGKLSTDFQGTVYAPAGWYKSGTNSYYWDGSQWGSVTPCP
jgi:hypothetical protein